MKEHRVQRVADLITREVAMIMRTKSSDQRFTLATVTGAKVSRDLKIAHVFISVMGDDREVNEVMESLKAARGYFRREIGHSLKLKYTPEIRFVFDEAMARGRRVLKELDRITREPPSPEDDAGAEV